MEKIAIMNEIIRISNEKIQLQYMFNYEEQKFELKMKKIEVFSNYIFKMFFKNF